MDRRRLLRSAQTASHESVPVKVAYFVFLATGGYAWGRDELNDLIYDQHLNANGIWVTVPAISTVPGAATSTNFPTKIDCEKRNSDPTFELAAGQYRAIIEFSGYQGPDAAGHTREIFATLCQPDGTVATTATAYDSQLGIPDRHALIIPGMYIPASGKYSFAVFMQSVAGLEQGVYYTHSVRLERLDENA